MSTRSPSRKAVEGRGLSLAEFNGRATVGDANLQVVPTLLDRSQRRRKQAHRESEKAKRQKDGKKAFYLSLDSQGRPYGLAVPAWVAEINKLAIHLDPSVTHIKKQTFEAV